MSIGKPHIIRCVKHLDDRFVLVKFYDLSKLFFISLHDKLYNFLIESISAALQYHQRSIDPVKSQIFNRHVKHSFQVQFFYTADNLSVFLDHLLVKIIHCFSIFIKHLKLVIGYVIFHGDHRFKHRIFFQNRHGHIHTDQQLCLFI